MLSALPLELVDPDGSRIAFEVDEGGETFLENARRKAEAGMRAAGFPALGEDSGIEVEALGGWPGVRSTRFASDRTAEDRSMAVIRALDESGAASRAASFRSAAVLALPDGRCFEGEGLLAGTIARQPRGHPGRGFGYDPVFVLPDGRHLAELTVDEKNLLSHRARALAALEVRGAFGALLAC